MSLFAFDNSFVRALEGLYVPFEGDVAPAPEMLAFNTDLADELRLDAEALGGHEGARIFSGSKVPSGAEPVAMAYAGHQFGGYSPRLGDGRALLLGEVIDQGGARRDIHLKGSGRTPFSRGGDGKAAIGPVLREYLVAEAMHALGVPSTRALAAVATGETVLREGPQKGAVLARVAASHLRVGTFQYVAAQGDKAAIQGLANYAIARHYPEVADDDAPYLSFLRAVMSAQARLVARWMSLGFVHGVMNTDNMTISGETIDYGPCAFIDAYNPKAVFSSIDQFGRYAYGNQPNMALWNIARLAECLLPLIDENPDKAVEIATDALQDFSPLYDAEWLALMRAKLGLSTSEDGDKALIEKLLSAMHTGRADFTQTFRALSKPQTARGLFAAEPEGFDAWLPDYETRLDKENATQEDRVAVMQRMNPVYIPRNHLVEEALSAANEGDHAPFEVLLERVTSPFVAVSGAEAYAAPAPSGFGPYRTFCGT